jgi:anti-sigma B factor antagonist
VGATWSIVSVPDGSVCIEVRGEVDLVAEAPLVEQVDALAGSDETSTILLDLGAVDFIDSSGVRALIRVRREHGDRVRLVAASHPVRRVLDIAGLTHGLGLDESSEPDSAEESDIAEGREAG